MPRCLTKICGLNTPDTVAAAAHLGADFIGFVHFAKSPRHVPLDGLAQLASRAGGAGKVLLLVDPEFDLIAQAMACMQPDVIQLHGSETPQFLVKIKRRYDVKLWKALPVRTSADLAAARNYEGLVDRVLFDAKPPADSNLPGGNGLRFDWELLRGVRINQPWGLSGGLDPANVAEAIAITNAPLVDVSSGVEDAPGQKNVDKMAAFLNAVQQS